MPNIAQATTATNAQFRQSDILKFIQENGTRVLWKDVNGLDYITKKGPWKGGKECRYHMVVDAGGLEFGGLVLEICLEFGYWDLEFYKARP
jgi:hypothetical protein